MPAVLSLLTLPLQGLGQAHPIQHPGQLPTTPAVGPPHPECPRVGRLMWVPALGVPSCARLHLTGGVTLGGSSSQEACSGMWESAYKARGAVQASRWGPWHQADLKLKPGEEAATGLSAWEIQKLKPNVEEKIRDSAHSQPAHLSLPMPPWLQALKLRNSVFSAWNGPRYSCNYLHWAL